MLCSKFLAFTLPTYRWLAVHPRNQASCADTHDYSVLVNEDFNSSGGHGMRLPEICRCQECHWKGTGFPTVRYTTCTDGFSVASLITFNLFRQARLQQPSVCGIYRRTPPWSMDKQVSRYLATPGTPGTWLPAPIPSLANTSIMNSWKMGILQHPRNLDPPICRMSVLLCTSKVFMNNRIHGETGWRSVRFRLLAVRRERLNYVTIQLILEFDRFPLRTNRSFPHQTHPWNGQLQGSYEMRCDNQWKYRYWVLSPQMIIYSYAFRIKYLTHSTVRCQGNFTIRWRRGLIEATQSPCNVLDNSIPE